MHVIGLTRAHVVGHSMGGYIALQMAVRHPEGVLRLVVVDAAAVPTGRTVLAQSVPLLRSARNIAPAFLPVLALDALRAGPLTLMRTARDVVRADIRPALGSVSAATLIVWGERDHMVPLSVGKVLHQAIPRSHLHVVEAAGHVPMFEQPQRFSEVVLAFLEGESAERSS